MITLKAVETEKELSELASLADQIWHEFFTELLSVEQINYMVQKFQSKEAMKEQIKTQGYEYFFIMKNNEICGYTGIKPEEGKLFLSKLYLKSSCRGKHLASQVFTKLFQMARDQKLTAIWLTVNKYNNHAIAVYQKTGFETIRAQVTDIGHGFVMDDYVMEKSLTSLDNVV